MATTRNIPVLMPATNGCDACHTCTRRADAPYRVYDKSGKAIGGCVAEFHTGHVYGFESVRWHNRPEAQRVRAETVKFYTEGKR